MFIHDSGNPSIQYFAWDCPMETIKLISNSLHFLVKHILPLGSNISETIIC